MQSVSVGEKRNGSYKVAIQYSYLSIEGTFRGEDYFAQFEILDPTIAGNVSLPSLLESIKSISPEASVEEQHNGTLLPFPRQQPKSHSFIRNLGSRGLTGRRKCSELIAAETSAK